MYHRSTRPYVAKTARPLEGKGTSSGTAKGRFKKRGKESGERCGNDKTTAPKR